MEGGCQIGQSHSSLKSYTEYWLPGWLACRDVDVDDEAPARDGRLAAPRFEGPCCGCDCGCCGGCWGGCWCGGWCGGWCGWRLDVRPAPGWPREPPVAAPRMRRKAARGSAVLRSERAPGDWGLCGDRWEPPADAGSSALASSLSSLRQMGQVPCCAGEATLSVHVLTRSKRTPLVSLFSQSLAKRHSALAFTNAIPRPSHT